MRNCFILSSFCLRVQSGEVSDPPEPELFQQLLGLLEHRHFDEYCTSIPPAQELYRCGLVR